MLQSVDALQLLEEQKEAWDLVGTNYAALDKVKTKSYEIDGNCWKVQFNPARIVSSSAKVDAASIKQRKCFLCKEQLPAVQRGIPFGEKYQVLVNPFPIFPQHLTIPSVHHELQLIQAHYKDMLHLAQSLAHFTIFYNGPKCGASAPDHLHFQAGNKGFLPIEKEWKKAQLVHDGAEAKLYALTSSIRQAFVIQSSSVAAADAIFQLIYQALPQKENEVEPMMNILTWYEDGMFVSCIFPRAEHRPSCFFATDEAKKMLISPASVDMGGVLITPLEKDFDHISASCIRQIMQEVCLSAVDMAHLVECIKQKL